MSSSQASALCGRRLRGTTTSETSATVTIVSSSSPAITAAAIAPAPLTVIWSLMGAVY